MYTILGAGLSGLSIADHLLKQGIPFEIFESKSHGGGHIYSEVVDGFTWDEGPHVSFTQHQYVKDYFAANCRQQYLEYSTNPTNYFKSSWIPHPAQSNMYAVAEPLRSECIASAKMARAEYPADYLPANYQEWIDYAFGKKFAEVFPAIYTKKYWTTEPTNLSTDWIGKRIYFPELSDMIDSATAPLDKQTHYISKVRYPKNGGYYSYIKGVEKSIPVKYNKQLDFISFKNKQLFFSDGKQAGYDKLISTLPLPQLVLHSDAPENIKNSASKLKCSQVLLINVVVDHPPVIPNHWIYVYDENFYATRINFTDLLAPANGIVGKCGIQVEVYFSDYHPITESTNHIEQAVLKELISMQLIKSAEFIESYHSKWINWANVIFDKERLKAQDEVFAWLEGMGMAREENDLEPMTVWEKKQPTILGDIILAGRFAQWKYFWTDDCVMRAKFISENLND